MKMKKIIRLFLVMTIICFASCNSSDDELSGVLKVKGSIDVSELTKLTSNDATALVSLNGEAAATYTTEASIGDEISYEVISTSSDVEIVILDFFYTSGNRELWEIGIEQTVDSQSSVSIASLKVINGLVGDEVKFGFTFALKTNGILDTTTTYIVDPKIRVRS
jgi:hypothetical protein